MASSKIIISRQNDDVLFQQAIQGLVSGLDRYSRYLSPEDYKQLREYTEGDWPVLILICILIHS